MSSFLKLIRPHLLKFAPYSSARDEAKKGQIWLNANEFPWDDETQQGMNRYPNKQPEELKEYLAAFYEVSFDQLLLTRGSDEGIDLLIRLLCDPSDRVIICPPTFGMYNVCAELQNCIIDKIPLISEENFQPNLEALKIAGATSKLIFLCSPNNPTGNVINENIICELCQFLPNTLIVVDEAYVEFANAESFSRYLNTYSNLIILRTLSKAFGLAAARIGVVLANPEIIQWLTQILPPYPIAKPAALIALEKFKNSGRDNLLKQINLIKSEREKLIKAFKQFHFINMIYPSEANFILFQANNSQDLMNFLTDNGVILRSMAHHAQLVNGLRVTIGSPEENTILLETLRKYEKNIIY